MKEGSREDPFHDGGYELSRRQAVRDRYDRMAAEDRRKRLEEKADAVIRTDDDKFLR